MNAIPEYIFNDLNIKVKLNPCNYKVSCYPGKLLQIIGECYLNVDCEGINERLEFVIVKAKIGTKPVLGLLDNENLGLVKFLTGVEECDDNDLVTEYCDVFRGEGHIKTQEYGIELKPEYKLEVVPCRNVAFQLMGKLKEEFKKTMEWGITTKVTRPNEFVNPIAIIKKNRMVTYACVWIHNN